MSQLLKSQHGIELSCVFLRAVFSVTFTYRARRIVVGWWLTYSSPSTPLKLPERQTMWRDSRINFLLLILQYLQRNKCLSSLRTTRIQKDRRRVSLQKRQKSYLLLDECTPEPDDKIQNSTARALVQEELRKCGCRWIFIFHYSLFNWSRLHLSYNSHKLSAKMQPVSGPKRNPKVLRER